MLEVLLPVTGLSKHYRKAIQHMAVSDKGLHIKCERPKGKVDIQVKAVYYNSPDSTVTVLFTAIGSLNDNNEQAIIKEKIRELFDVRYY